MSNVIFETVRGIDAVPINDHFLRDGRIFLTEDISSSTCDETIKQLIYLEQNPDIKEITIYIDSPGGDVTAGLSLYDYIRMVSASKPVKTICLGMCASMGAILFLAADDRRKTSHGQIMIHDPAFGGPHDIGGKKPGEVQIELDNLNKCRESLGKIISERTGKTIQEVYKLTEHDTFFTAEEAVENNIATSVIDDIKETR